MVYVGYIFSEIAMAAVAVALICHGHWIAACVMAILLSPQVGAKTKEGL